MADALQSILTQAGLALAPLRGIKSADQATALFRKLGYEIPAGAFGSELSALSTGAGELVDAIRQLTTASDDASTAAAIANMFTRLEAMAAAIQQLHDQIESTGGSVIPNLKELPRRLTDFLLLDFLDRQRADMHATLHLLGLIEYEPHPAQGNPMRLINWDRFPQVFTDPMQIVNDTYHWDSDFDFDKFLVRLDQMMRSTALPGGIYPQSDAARTALGNTATNLREMRFPIFQKGFTAETYSQFGITFSPAEARDGQKKGFALLPYLMGAAAFDFGVCDRGELNFKSSADITGVGIVIRPPLDAKGILNVAAALNASIEIREKPEKAEELVLFGTSGATRLAVQGMGIKWFVSEEKGKLDLGVETEIQTLRLVIDGGDGDGFLQKVLSGVHVKAEANATFGMTLLTGFAFSGGAQLALEIPLCINAGPVTIQSLRLALAPASDRIRLDAGAAFQLAIGPVQVVVQDVGLRADLEFHSGNVGSANLDIGFKPPTGAGISVQSAVVTGGGFLSFDFDKGQYSGVLALSIENITITAIGLINTKLPGGASGFSFVVIITAVGFQPIPLGLGFNLTGIGGLLAINRTCNVDFLREGLKTNSLANLLFPKDPIRNAPQILGLLSNAFPPQMGSFLFGPAVQICWGTPVVLTMDLALILELGQRTRLIIMGRVASILPTEKNDLIRLQLNALGVIDFDQSSISLDATLYDSRLLGKFPITGGMAMRLNWGSAPVFALSVGGFHPAFKPPPNFPVPDRLAISFSNSADLKLRAECYYALTSNTLQWGAKAELTASSGGFSIDGHIGYDVLIQFDPFSFVADFSASVQLKYHSSNLFKVSVDGELSGPQPLHVKGKATFEIFWCDFSVGFDRTLVDGAAPPKLAPVNVNDLLVAALSDGRNWAAQLSDKDRRMVTLVDAPADDLIRIHPLGQVSVKQKVVPLDLKISRFGNTVPAGANTFTVKSVTIGGNNVTFQPAMDFFAPSQFLDLSDDEKLAAPSFESMKAGVALGSPRYVTATNDLDIIVEPIEYETILIDKANPDDDAPQVRAPISIGVMESHLSLGAAGRSVLRTVGKAKYAPATAKNGVVGKGWTIASTTDGTLQGVPDLKAGTIVSYAQSFQAMQEAQALDPAARKSLMLVRVSKN